MLFLIGLGLDSKDISIHGLETAKRCDALFVDSYTNYIDNGYISFLEGETGKSIQRIDRSDLEENASMLIGIAKEKDIAVFVSGDPFLATTHQSIILDAVKAKVKYRVIHGSSIMGAAAGEAGLIAYRFGQTTTVPFWTEKYKPTSFLDVINSNLINLQHTLVLLDYKSIERKKMDLGEALDILRAADKEKGYNIINGYRHIIVLGDVGKDTQDIAYMKIQDIGEKIFKRFANKLTTIIIPAKLTAAEAEFVSMFG
jgi:diphthine synthase